MTSYQSYSDSNEPPMNTFYQQQHHDDSSFSSSPAPNVNEIEWDPEALGQQLLSDESGSDWSAVTNLDAFFCKVYTYYVEKGFWCMIAARITNLLTLAFTICFSTFLLLFVNWHSLFFCNSSDSCDDIVGFRSGVFSSPGTLEILVFIYFGVFCVFWLWNLLSFVYTLRDAIEMRQFYQNDLMIQDDDLVSLEWHYILENLVQVSARKKLCIVKDLTALDITNRIMRKENYMIAMINLDLFQFGPRDAQGRWNVACDCWKQSQKRSSTVPTKVQEMQPPSRKVLRERGTNPSSTATTSTAKTPSNPLTSPPPTKGLKDRLLSDGTNVIHPNTTTLHIQPTTAANSYSTFTSPTGVSAAIASHPATRFASATAAKKPPEEVFSSWWSWAIMGTTLDWNIRFCVLNSLFDSHFYIHSSYLGSSGIQALKLRFMILGVANFILSPFIMLFMITFFFLKHAEELHSKKTLFGPRQWCNLAQWKLREFNELPHFFERRLTLSSVAAQQYMQQFPNTLVSIIAQSIAYITGALVAILLLLTVTDSDIITHRIFDRTLLWYLAVFSAILALSRSMIPDKTVYPAPALVMQEVVKHTHYSPIHWRNRTHTSYVHKEFTYMYPSRLSMFCYEIMSVIMTPLVLIFCLPHSAERIVQFVSTRTVNVQGVGHLCSYAMFDIEKHGDTRYSHIPSANLAGSTTTTGLARQTSGGEQKDNRPGSLTLGRQSSHPATGAGAFPLRLKHGKMEKSFLGFSMANPHWKPQNAEDGGSGAKFLSNLADTLYGGEEQAEIVNSKKFRPGNSVRFASNTNLAGAAAASSKLPSTSTHMERQDSLDSNTTEEEEFDVEKENEHHHFHDEQKYPDEEKYSDPSKSTSASYDLSQSNRHLIQSFADLVGMDPTMQSTLNPSQLMRQSSLGDRNVGASMMGMSTMLGLNSRRPPPQAQLRGGNTTNSQLYASNTYHPTNSVLLNGSTMLNRGMGGLQGGISASMMLHLDPQSMREQLMLAQADQQADLFALLEGRLDEDQPPRVDEEDEQQNEDDEENHSYHHHHQQQRQPDSDDDAVSNIDPLSSHRPPPTAAFQSQPTYAQPPISTYGMDIPYHSPAPSSHPPSSASGSTVSGGGQGLSTSPATAYTKPSSFDARQYSYSSSTPPDANAQSILYQHRASRPEPEDDESNEPPPTSFFNS